MSLSELRSCVKVEVVVLGSPESRDGRPGLPVPTKAYGFCGRKATLNYSHRAHEPCESRGGRPGLPIANKPLGFWR